MTEFTNNLHEDIKLYLSDSVQLLLNFLTNQTFSKEVRYWALMALGAIESSAEKKILPYQETILKKVIKYANKYGDAPVPQDEMEDLAKKLQTTIKINDPIGKSYITYNPSGDRTCILMNPRKDHVEESNEEMRHNIGIYY